MNVNDTINIAKGCVDYSGGYPDKELEIFHHGIQTVVNALEGARRTKMGDLQSKVLHSIGARIDE